MGRRVGKGWTTRRTARRLAAGALLAVAPAQASEPKPYPPCTKDKPSPADIQGATIAHKSAKEWYERGDYDRAIQQWRDAYNFDCTKPAVFINLANAHERNGDKAEAQLALQTYLDRNPFAPDASIIQARIENLKAALAASRPATTTATTAPNPGSGATTGGGGDPAAPRPDPAATTGAGDVSAAPPVAEGDAKDAQGSSLLPWIVAGAGGVIVLAGGAFLAMGLDKVSTAEARCPSRSQCSKADTQLGNTGLEQQTMGWIGLGVGAAVVAGGLFWAFSLDSSRGEDAKRAREAGARLVPQVAPDRAGLAVMGRF